VIHRISQALAGLLAVVALSLPCTGHAQPTDDSEPPIRVIHRPLASGAIPQIGSPMDIQVELVNTFDIDSKIRLVGAKDGRFIDIAFPRGALNAMDRPTFHIEIPSPVAAMTYQFIVHQRDGSLSSSERFSVKRECIQNFKIAIPENAPNSDFKREVSSLIAQAKILERDTTSLEASLKLIEDIKASLTN
jgi:hypothetical protein